MDKKDFREMLLDALDDKKVQSKLEEIQNYYLVNKNMKNEREIRPSVSHELEQWQNCSQKHVNLADQYLQVIKELKSKNYELEKNLNKIKQQLQDEILKNAKLNNENNCIKNKRDNEYETFRKASSDMLAQLQTEIKELKQENSRLKDNIREQQGDCINLQDHIKELECQLADCFSAGRLLYKDFWNIDEHSKQLLSSIFSKNSFENFICCGVRLGAIDKIWEVTFSCINKSNNRDAEILFACFKYFVTLYNETQEEPILALLSTEIGETFDNDYHIPFAGSRAQGQVSQVILPGYYDRIKNKLLKKSVVLVE